MIAADGSVSDETVLYTGKFKALDKEVSEALTTQLENAALEYTKELARLTDENTRLKQENGTLRAIGAQLNLTIQQLRASNQQLSNELASVTADMPEYSDPKKALQASAELQSKTEQVKPKVTGNVTAATKTNAKNLEKYF